MRPLDAPFHISSLIFVTFLNFVSFLPRWLSVGGEFIDWLYMSICLPTTLMRSGWSYVHSCATTTLDCSDVVEVVTAVL